MKAYGSTVKISLHVPVDLLQKIDYEAEREYSTRSALIRQAALYYVEPAGHRSEAIDPEELVKYLNKRKLKAALNELRKDLDDYH